MGPETPVIILILSDFQVFFDWSAPKGPLYLLPETVPNTNKGVFELPLLAPSTVDELVAILKSAAATAKEEGAKRQIRIVGAGHSWSAVAKSDDLQLSLCNYKVCG